MVQWLQMDMYKIPVPIETCETPVERLLLSPRTLNALKRAHITMVGEVLEITKEEILRIRGFGEKNYSELCDRLREMNFLPFVFQVNYHINSLVAEVMKHPELRPEARDVVLPSLRHLQNQLLSMEYSNEPLTEKVAMMQASLREIHRFAPEWVMARIKAMFAEQAFSAYMGVAFGAALTKLLS